MAEVQNIPWKPEVGRIESGAVQFQDDWPGLFQRGDDSMAILMAIRTIRRHFEVCPLSADTFIAMQTLNGLAETIEKQVLLGGPKTG